MPTWSDDPFARPTQVRHQLLLFLGSLSFVLYLDRVCLGQALKPISEELQISETGMGWILGAFTLAYGLFEVPTGHWGDRFGSRRVLTRSRILEEVWGFDFPTSGNALEVYVGYLRRKTEAEGEPRLIHTVRGVGYVLRETPP